MTLRRRPDAIDERCGRELVAAHPFSPVTRLRIVRYSAGVTLISRRFHDPVLAVTRQVMHAL